MVGANNLNLSFRSGVRGTIACGAIGAIAALLGVAAYGLFEWWNDYDEVWGYRDWLGWTVSTAAMPAVGSATIFACAGWATHAVRPPLRFVASLLIVFLISIAMWMTIIAMEITPRRIKSVDHPFMYPSEALALFGPPAVAAAIVTVVRLGGGTTREEPRAETRP